MEFDKVAALIKSDFCSLTTTRISKNVLEVITPYATANNKLVSVFVTTSNGKIVITDNGWIDKNYYNIEDLEDKNNTHERAKLYYLDHFGIKSTKDKFGVIFNYKTCDSEEQISRAIFDLGNFCAGVLSIKGIDFNDQKDVAEREHFKSDVNQFLRINFPKDVKLNEQLEDLRGVKFNAILSRKQDISLITYITGSSSKLFIDDLRSSIVNFELSLTSKYNGYIKNRLSLVNDECDGYKLESNSPVMVLLKEKTTSDPIRWNERDQLLSILS